MALTTAQLATLKAAILADGAINTQPMNDDGHLFIRDYYRALASPSFTVWKTAVTLEAVCSTVDAVELVGITQLKMTAFQCLLLGGTVNPSKANVRNAFDQVFSAASGTTTRPLLLALWKRLANRAEKLFATGTGSDGSPATMTFEGNLTTADVSAARNS